MRVMRRGWILYPDDLHHPYSLPRAWDRHLVSVGLLPIFTSDTSKVGPILVNPVGPRVYFHYIIDSGGFLNSILQEANVQEASDTTEERTSEQVQSA
jgi:hypothetical protein